MWGSGDAAAARKSSSRPSTRPKRSAGTTPRVFVDVCIRREVRAVGFRGDAFEKLLGRGRHHWMDGLGNRAVIEGGPMVLKDPRVVSDLLDLIVKSDRARRRVIFFCACEMPRNNGERWCHRDLIAELVTDEARRRRVALSVSEWPGGVPRRLLVRFPATATRAALNDTTKSVPMSKELQPAIGVSLPWGSYAVVEGPDGRVPLMVGPAIHRQGRWSLQRRLPTPGGSDEAQWQRTILACRKAWGYEPRLSSASARAPEPLWEELIVA